MGLEGKRLRQRREAAGEPEEIDKEDNSIGGGVWRGRTQSCLSRPGGKDVQRERTATEPNLRK